MICVHTKPEFSKKQLSLSLRGFRIFLVYVSVLVSSSALGLSGSLQLKLRVYGVQAVQFYFSRYFQSFSSKIENTCLVIARLASENVFLEDQAKMLEESSKGEQEHGAVYIFLNYSDKVT